MELEEFKQKFNLPRINDYVACLTIEQKNWFWQLLWDVKQVFPKIDIYYSEGGTQYGYLGFGKKGVQEKRVGKRNFLFVLRLEKNKEDGFNFTLYISNQSYELIKENKKEYPQGYDKAIQEKIPFKQWLGKVKEYANDLGINFIGEDLFPVNYKDEPDSQETLVNHNLNEDKNMQEKMLKQPLNRILFGAAGTGKTFTTVNHALSIIENKSLEELGTEAREELKKRFDGYKENGKIKFVTFHQSFSYEDFVEGIRANTDENGNLTYDVQAGIFKEICNDAKENKNTLKDLGVRPNAEIWKLSIGDLATRQYCFDHGQIRVGWGQTGDLLDEDTKSTESYQQFSSTDHHTLDQFVSGVEVGDVVLCLKGVNEICGVAVVRDDYFFDKNHPEGVREDYLHCRNVNWILKDISFNIRELNGGIGLTLKTMYRLWRFTWTDLLHELNKVGYLLDNKVEEKLDPYILIIDEINRGNISRIFGELITLIEDSKRAGADEELSVTLPYSKKEFTVPQNVYIIGTMNSSDRSLTGLDIALRRRFTFIEMPPRPKLLEDVSVDGVDIEKLLMVINQRIEVLLDRDHCIGHANFMHLKEQPTLNNLSDIFKQKIIPQLQEYFFDDWSKINMVLNNNGMLKAESQQKSSMFPNANIDDLGYFEDKKTWELVPGSFNAIESFAKIIQH